MTTLQMVQTRSESQPWMRDVILVLLSSLALGVVAQFSFRLPFTPVPIVLTNSLAVFFGIALGPRRGALAVMAYLVQGACGLPVFANGGAGFFYLLGPTGGYLLGFVPGAFAAGCLAGRSVWSKVVALTVGHAMVYLFGVSHLAAFVGWNAVLALGVLPFLPGCLVKTVALACSSSLNRRSA